MRAARWARRRTETYVGGPRGRHAPVRLDASAFAQGFGATSRRAGRATFLMVRCRLLPCDEARPDVLEDGFGGPAGGEGVPRAYVEPPAGRPDPYNSAYGPCLLYSQ